jgi:CRISPR/Cas system CSM-associated protein Csm3 (group 7 of RAMP superfamily)
MARAISARLRLQGTLVATTPLHVGGFGEDVDTDLPLARNGRGEWYVPGTSLAGPFRHWCERRFGNEFVRRLWGFQEGEEGHASYVIVEDAAVENADSVLTKSAIMSVLIVNGDALPNTSSLTERFCLAARGYDFPSSWRSAKT